MKKDNIHHQQENILTIKKQKNRYTIKVKEHRKKKQEKIKKEEQRNNKEFNNRTVHPRNKNTKH